MLKDYNVLWALIRKTACCNYYRIAENFRGRKLSRFGTKREFRGENFRGLQLLCVGVALTRKQRITQRAQVDRRAEAPRPSQIAEKQREYEQQWSAIANK